MEPACIMTAGPGRAAVPICRTSTVPPTATPPAAFGTAVTRTVETVAGVPDAYVAASRKVVPPEGFAQWEAGVRALYDAMAVITITPDHAVLLDFETTIPRAVADLVAARA